MDLIEPMRRALAKVLPLPRDGRSLPRWEFLKLLPENAPVLEIGPFGNPAVRGRHVKYFDVMDRAKLIEHAKFHGVPQQDIPEIDYVSPNGDLGAVGDKFRAVLSSHCIEHQPDLIRHLQQVGDILTEGGCYYVIAPDKRYCFDHFFPESIVEDVLQAHREGRKVHTRENVINCVAMTTHNECARHWKGDHGEKPNDPERLRQAAQLYEDAKGNYIDVHSLFFRPASFRSVIGALHEMGLTKLKPVRVYETPKGSNEFCAILQFS